MKIELALFASLAAFLPGGGKRGARILEVEDGTAVADIIADLGLPDAPRIVFVNNRGTAEETVLKDGDRLAIFPPIAGG